MEDRTVILQRLSETNQSLVDRYLVSARETLARLVATPGLLDNIKLERAPAGYARNLIFGDDQMSAWALVWSPGARTFDPRPPLFMLLRNPERDHSRGPVQRR